MPAFFSTTIGRIAYAIIVGIVTFLIVYGIGLLLGKFLSPDFGAKVEQFAPVLGILAAIVSFFAGWTPTRRAV